MTHYNTLGNGMKIGLVTFSGKITKSFGKPVRKFISEMLYGMISSNSCKLTDISRALKEPIAVKKTVDRLGRHLSEFTQREKLMRDYLAAVKTTIGSDTMLLIDGGDAVKPCSPKMESIGIIRDGDTGRFAPGYWTIGAAALSGETRQPIPVYENLYPCKKQGGLGSAEETAKCLQHLREHFDSGIVRVFDRGFDTRGIMNGLLKNGEAFIMRANQDRAAVHKGCRSYIRTIARNVACEHELVYTGKNTNRVNCKIGMTQVTVPSFDNAKLTLVVCKGFGEPLVLYTKLTEPPESIAVRIVKTYLMRWRIEELYAFKKQGLNFEDFRVRSLNSIKNLDLLLTIAIGYIGMLCGGMNKTVIELIAASKRIEKTKSFLKKKKFLFYAVLDGITSVFASLRCGIAHFFLPVTKDSQLALPEFR